MKLIGAEPLRHRLARLVASDDPNAVIITKDYIQMPRSFMWILPLAALGGAIAGTGITAALLFIFY